MAEDERPELDGMVHLVWVVPQNRPGESSLRGVHGDYAAARRQQKRLQARRDPAKTRVLLHSQFLTSLFKSGEGVVRGGVAGG